MLASDAFRFEERRRIGNHTETPEREIAGHPWSPNREVDVSISFGSPTVGEQLTDRTSNRKET